MSCRLSTVELAWYELLMALIFCTLFEKILSHIVSTVTKLGIGT